MLKKSYLALIISISLLLVNFSIVTFAESSKDVNDIKEINDLVDKCRAKIESSSAQKVILVMELIDGDWGQISDWVIFDPVKDPQVAGEAHLYIENRKLIAVSLWEYEESGDQFRYSEFFFRDNGTIAHVFCNLRTFYGDLSIETRQFYNVKGKLIKETKDVFDLETNKPLDKKLIDSEDYQWHIPTVYRSTKAILKEFKYSLEMVERSRWC